jgi:uncharacterized protein YjbJ (UPF0337 family)
LEPAHETVLRAGATQGQLPKRIRRRRLFMNQDVLGGKWKQVRGEAKAWWGKLTDDDLDRAAGKVDVLAGLLQEKYGYTHQRAVDEIDERVTQYEAGLKAKTAPLRSRK